MSFFTLLSTDFNINIFDYIFLIYFFNAVSGHMQEKSNLEPNSFSFH